MKQEIPPWLLWAALAIGVVVIAAIALYQFRPVDGTVPLETDYQGPPPRAGGVPGQTQPQ